MIAKGPTTSKLEDTVTTAALPVYRTTIGKKAVMAATGLVLFGFVVAHMVGNLKVFQGREHFNDYAEGLRALGSPILGHEQALWGMRSVLLASVVLHMWAAWSTTRVSRAARGPVGYQVRKPVVSSYASRTMRWGGVILALFVVYHLLHMTTGHAHGSFVHGDAYGNLVRGFQTEWLVIPYAIAVGALALHVNHGLWSMFQTLGRGSGRFKDVLRGAATFFSVALFVGYLLGPVAIAIGVIE